MKTKIIVFSLLLSVLYISCEDSIGRVGLGIQPDEDKIVVYDTTVIVGARTIEVDSVYAKTVNALLGDFYDPTFGNIKSSYICQYYPSIGFSSLDSVESINSVTLNIYYYTFLGDSMAPMEVTVYPVVKPLDKHYYTNGNPGDYCDLNNPIGKCGYTPRNLNYDYSDLVNSNYLHQVTVTLPIKIGQDYFNKLKNNELQTLEAFLDFFPGTYLTTTFGTGSMIAVEMTDVNIHYTRRKTFKDENGTDSIDIVNERATFNVTKEIIQLNKFENKNPDYLLDDNPDKVFIKSPAGVFTELTIPIREIVKGIGKKKFSSVKLSLKAYPRSNHDHEMIFPGWPTSTGYYDTGGFKAKLLLIEPDSVINFFEMKSVANNKTSYTTQFNTTTYTYDFNNISNVVQNAIDKAPERDLKLWLIPVLTTWYSQNVSYGSSVDVDYITSHYLYPSGVTLKKGGDNLKVRVIATDLKINE